MNKLSAIAIGLLLFFGAMLWFLAAADWNGFIRSQIEIHGSKLTGEQYCKIYSDLFEMNVVCLRPFNIYGARQNDAYAGVISKFYDRLKNNKHPIIFGNGKQTRDFIHVSDIAMAFLLSIKYNKKKFDVFNLATSKSTSIIHLAKLFAQVMNKSKLKTKTISRTINFTLNESIMLW